MELIELTDRIHAMIATDAKFPFKNFKTAHSSWTKRGSQEWQPHGGQSRVVQF